ncbi:hypothetical protein V7S43_017042 [Phytophthora oleae]|uniref:PWWP domain-containing protein n=1 Tax=Phytophthora oleae TaxID=2107226 RepID=A0ABD3EXX8_9STRA
MVATQKTKSSPRRRLPSRLTVVLTKGDWLDVMDQDGVWNVARVLSVPSPEEVEVMYDGWPEEYDEVVRVDSDRVAPFHTFTWVVKCWVKYLNWPMWPSVITIRTPGTEEGIENLAKEKQLYVDFLDDPNFDKRDQCWQKKKQVVAFENNYDTNRVMTNGSQFEKALEYALLSNATTKMPTFSKGTLPLQYNQSTTESVGKMRKNMGNDLWYRSFANNKSRHRQAHIYKVLKDGASDSGILAQMNKLDVRRPISSKPEKRSSQGKKQSRSKILRDNAAVKIEQDLPEEIEVPYEPETSESSDDQGGISDGDFHDQTKTTAKRRVLPRAAPRSTPLIKMAAKRSVPPITGYLTLTASPNLRSTRSSSLASDTDESEEEKGDLTGKVKLGPKFTASGREQSGGLTQAFSAAASTTSRRSTSTRGREESLPLVEERIAFAQNIICGLDAKKQELIKATAQKERRKRVKPSLPSAQGITASRSNENKSSFLRASEKRMGVDARRQGGFTKTPLEVGLEVTNSFLSIEDAYSSDSQAAKRVSAPNDEDAAMLDAQSEPKETKRTRRSQSPRLTERKGTVDFKQLDEEVSDDEARLDAKSQEVRRPFCMMQAGIEGKLHEAYLSEVSIR